MAMRSFRSATDEQWAKAERRARVLDRVIFSSDPRHVAVSRAAVEERVSERQIYRWLGRYEPNRNVTDLLGRYGRRAARLHPRVQAIIAEELDNWCKDKEERRLAETVGTIGDRCELEGLPRPTRATVESHLAKLPIEDLLRRESSPEAARRLKPRPGYIKRPDAPLDHVQIDSTETDLNLIDRHYRLLGRPTLVLAVDVYSGAPLGFAITLEKPSALTTALCLSHAVLPKEAWLKARGIDVEWPMNGLMWKLSMDGGPEFKNDAVIRACEEYRIEIAPRRAYNKQDRSIIERLIGTMMGIVNTMPGKTGRNVIDRGDYPSEKNACLQLHELERVLAYAIAGVHLLEPNSKTHRIPMEEWLSASSRIRARPFDAERFRIDFLPRVTRKLDSFGFSLNGLDYYDSAIADLVGDRERIGKVEIAVDPRDVSHVWVAHPITGTYVTVGRRDLVKDLISKAEVLADNRHRIAHGKASHQKTIPARKKIDEIVTTSKAKKEEARRQARNEEAAAAQIHKRPEKKPVTLPKEEPKGTPQPFADIDLTWKV